MIVSRRIAMANTLRSMKREYRGVLLGKCNQHMRWRRRRRRRRRESIPFMVSMTVYLWYTNIIRIVTELPDPYLPTSLQITIFLLDFFFCRDSKIPTIFYNGDFRRNPTELYFNSRSCSWASFCRSKSNDTWRSSHYCCLSDGCMSLRTM